MLLSSGTMDKNVVSNVPRIMASLEDLSNYMLAYFGAFGRRGGLMVSMLDSGSSGPGSGPGRGHCVVFLVPLSIQVYKWVPANLMLGVTLRWTSIPSRGE